MATEARLKANAKYDAAHTKMYCMKLNLKHDKDVIDKLKSVGNIQGYIKDLIRADIAKDKTELRI